MKITTNRLKDIIREELSRINENQMTLELAEDNAEMFNSDHWGLSHQQLVRLIMQHGFVDDAYNDRLEFRDGTEHFRGDYVEETEDVDLEIDVEREREADLEAMRRAEREPDVR